MGLALCRWVSERYVAPLAAVLERATPPRVAAEEVGRRSASPDPVAREVWPPGVLEGYREGSHLVDAIATGTPGPWVLRPAPEHEGAVVVEAVARCLDAGRRALVIVPEAAPVPGTARAIAEAFGDDRVAMLLGGSKRARYRTWLDVQAGRFDVVVGSRPSVFAPVPGLGLIVVGRESHPALREDRAPYYHVRDVALARGDIEGAVVILSAMAPSSEAVALGLPTVAPRRRSWVPVEIVAPGPEGRAPRLVRALRECNRALRLLTASRVRHRRRVSRLRPAGRMRGLSGRAALERGIGAVRRLRGTGAMPHLWGAATSVSAGAGRNGSRSGRPGSRACRCTGWRRMNRRDSRPTGRSSWADPRTCEISAAAASIWSRSSMRTWPDVVRA